MSFERPLVLLALLGLPLLLAWYVAQQRRRRAVAAAFVTAALARNLAPGGGPRWRRHVPAAVLALALALLVVAAAKPERTVAVPAEQATIVLLTDVSGSMQARDVSPSRLEAARAAARAFVDRVPRAVNVGVMAFNQRPTILQSPTQDRPAVDDALARLQPSGGTATGEALRSALDVIKRQPGVDGRRPPAAIVLLSDGASVTGVDPLTAAREAKQAGVPVYAVTLGTAAGTIEVPRPRGQPGTITRSVPPDPATTDQIAEITGGRSTNAERADVLQSAYEQLGSQLGRREERREVTSSVAGGALLLLLAAAGLSLRWTGRPV